MRFMFKLLYISSTNFIGQNQSECGAVDDENRVKPITNTTIQNLKSLIRSSFSGVLNSLNQ